MLKFCGMLTSTFLGQRPTLPYPALLYPVLLFSVLLYPTLPYSTLPCPMLPVTNRVAAGRELWVRGCKLSECNGFVARTLSFTKHCCVPWTLLYCLHLYFGSVALLYPLYYTTPLIPNLLYSVLSTVYIIVRLLSLCFIPLHVMFSPNKWFIHSGCRYKHTSRLHDSFYSISNFYFTTSNFVSWFLSAHSRFYHYFVFTFN